jgi:hypothetical protein
VEGGGYVVSDAAIGEDESAVGEVAPHLDVAGVATRDEEDGRRVLEVAQLRLVIDPLEDPPVL